ncbi:MAG: HAD hydrolase-like protein [Amphritea sp.]
MTDIYLFDWGDTLMVDFPGIAGKMCDWETVAAVEGAEAALRQLSRTSRIYIATGAANSTEADIKAAFKRVNLDMYISGYFCKANLGVEKGSADFLPAILKQLNAQPQQVTVVGDTLHKDIHPAQALGIQSIWLCLQQTDYHLNSDLNNQLDNVRVITSLRELSE